MSVLFMYIYSCNQPKEANMAEKENKEQLQCQDNLGFDRRLSGEAMQETIVAMSHLDNDSNWKEQ